MRMRTLFFIGFERWGSLEPAWKVDPKGRLWIPLIWGLWARSWKLEKGAR